MARIKPRPQAKGNRCLLVIFDSRNYLDYVFVPETIFQALDHMGLPYRKLDLANANLQQEDLREEAVILLAQDHLGKSLGGNDVQAIVEAVEDGTGLVVFDHDIDKYGPDFVQWLGVETDNPTFEGVGMAVCWNIQISDNDHFITYTQDLGSKKELLKPLEVCKLKLLEKKLDVLIETDDGRPILVAGLQRKGRVVLFTIDPHVWSSQFYGHLAGLDDVFWKSIVWSARKPFIMAAMPPYIAVRLDDAQGKWRDKPFGYVDIMNDYGFVPNVALFMDDITPSGVERIRELQSAGRAEFSPHSLTYNELIYFRRGKEDYTPAEIERHTRHIDKLLSAWGVNRSAILNNHWFEIGRTALPYLKRIGQEYIMTSFLPGEPFEGVHKDWKPAPYGNITYVMDYLNGNPDLFSVMALDLPYHARTELPDGNYALNIATLTEWDFLFGNTTFNSENPFNNIDRAARAFSRHLRKGLDCLLFGSSITHEYMIAQLTPDEWSSLLKQALSAMTRYEKIFVGYDHVARYARSIYDTSIVRVEADKNGIMCDLQGQTFVPLNLYLFTDVDGSVEKRFIDVPVFKGDSSILVEDVRG